LIRRVLAAAPRIFTVIFTVNLSGTSIGAGLRAIRPKLTFRDQSTPAMIIEPVADAIDARPGRFGK
jgi:hypothetical protein